MLEKRTLTATLEVYESDRDSIIVPCAGCEAYILECEPCWVIEVWTDTTEPAHLGTFYLHKRCADLEPNGEEE